ncbi:hypothetical protein COCON_G00227360 [Conger conger]|uniref:Anaphase-promoting complex subunit 1 n=1 Tax=Conger conger TaxID=82655 RepID=A0A9Q1CX07_CONCO|nr:hypothetical protein COCON_G00227360 [Conger conger]
MSNVYEERATMIAAGELQSFVPFGREHCKNHPNAVNLQLRQLQPASELWSSDGAAGLVGSLQEVTLQEREKEWWGLRKGSGAGSDGAEYEEELYVTGNMVIWSRGSGGQASYVYKAFTALWCNFGVPQNKKGEPHVVERTVCIVQSTCVNVHTMSGKDFISPLPFQVSTLWPTKFGLLFERRNPASDVPMSPPRETLPTVFSMLHPLDEIAPVVCRSTGLFEASRVQYVSDSALRIVFSSCEPSLIMTYDTLQCAHTVWALRKVSSEEQLMVLKPEQVATPQNLMAPSFLNTHLRNVSKMESPASPFPSYSLHAQGRMTSSPPGLPSPTWPPSAHSPAISNMAALSRAHSPGMATPSFSGAQRFNMSCQSPLPRGHSLLASPNSTLNDSMATETEPIVPELCIEQLWTESSSGCREKSCQASKVFITTDLCDTKFLCFLVESHQQLRCVKFIESNDQTQLIFVSVTTIPAKDAAPLENIDAMLVLEANGSLVLYTGVLRVSKVFVPGVLAPSIGQSTPMPPPSAPVGSASTPARALIRPITCLDEVVMPSPVSDLRSAKHHENQHEAPSWLEDCLSQHTVPYVHTLRDPVHNRVTLELSSGTMLRITIPEIATSELVKRCLQAIKLILPLSPPAVERCLQAIKLILPKDVAAQALVKWYTVYNAPGGPSMHLEWSLFVTCFLSLMGYSTDRLAWTHSVSPVGLDVEVPLSPVIAPKKARPSEMGSDDDWEYLLGCDYHRQVESHPLSWALRLEALPPAKAGPAPLCQDPAPLRLDPGAPLFPHLPAVFLTLHLLYEDLQLDTLMVRGARDLVGLLQQLARDLQLEDYMELYWRDYPSFIVSFPEACVIDPAQLEQMSRPPFLTAEPPSILRWFRGCLRGEDLPPFPYLPGICTRTKLLVLSYALYIVGNDNAVTSDECKYLSKVTAGQKKNLPEPSLQRQSSVKASASCCSQAEKLVVWLASSGFTLKDLDCVPFGIALPIRNAIYQCREQPCSDWSEDVCLLIGRQDLTKQAHEVTLAKSSSTVGAGLTLDAPAVSEAAEEEEDGMNDINQEVTSLIWSQDLRVQEVRRLLQCSRPVRVNVLQLPEVSDHEFIEEKENRLLQLCQRTMALPVGRGLFTLFSYHPVPNEPLPVPKLNLTGRAPPRNAMVDLNSGNIDVPPNMTAWASFHNGVAAGLKIPPASQVDSAWIPTSPKVDSAWTPPHQAGHKPRLPQQGEPHSTTYHDYLTKLATLNIHDYLTKLATLNIHDYLTKGHEMTSIGLLLGVSAAKLGTMDMSITRLLSIHIPALLPPTSTELDVPHNVQVAAVVGLGLVYQGTGHRHNTEVLLDEIGRPPGPEMEYCTDRESYSLAAGLALGMVCLGHGSNLIGMTDLNVPEQLYQYMVGGHRRTHLAAINRYRSPSYQIKEGDTINVDVTGPGATLALAMIYLKTNNRSIADWLQAPDTMFLLDFIKPEFLLLRTLARCLIMWEEIKPETDWVTSNVPKIIQENLVLQEDVPLSEDLDIETLTQAHDYIAAGACLAVGFRFAGSAGSANSACSLRLSGAEPYGFARRFLDCLNTSAASLVGYYNVKTCLSMVLLAVSMVMAGSGNLQVLQLCRLLHKRTSGR